MTNMSKTVAVGGLTLIGLFILYKLSLEIWCVVYGLIN